MTEHNEPFKHRGKPGLPTVELLHRAEADLEAAQVGAKMYRDLCVSRGAEVERLREAVKYALDAFRRAGDEHACDYCRADAAAMERALDA